MIGPANIVIRDGGAGDWPSIRALLKTHALPLDGAQESLADFLVADQGGAIVGCIGLERHGDAALLRSCAVAAGHQGQSLGTELTRRIIDRGRQRGARCIALLTTTAENFFMRAGFVRIERDALPASLKASAEFRGACPATATAMALMLSSAE